MQISDWISKHDRRHEYAIEQQIEKKREKTRVILRNICQSNRRIFVRKRSWNYWNYCNYMIRRDRCACALCTVLVKRSLLGTRYYFVFASMISFLLSRQDTKSFSFGKRKKIDFNDYCISCDVCDSRVHQMIWCRIKQNFQRFLLWTKISCFSIERGAIQIRICAKMPSDEINALAHRKKKTKERMFRK